MSRRRGVSASGVGERVVEGQGDRVGRAQLERLDVRPLARRELDRLLHRRDHIRDEVLLLLLAGAHLEGVARAGRVALSTATNS